MVVQEVARVRSVLPLDAERSISNPHLDAERPRSNPHLGAQS